MTRTMTRMMHAKTNHAMALWKSFVATIVEHERAEREQELKMGRFLKKLMHQGTMRMFLAWIDFVEWRQGAKDLMTRTMTRMMNAKTNHAMALWKSFIAVEKQKQQDMVKLSRFVARLQHQQSMRILQSWLDYIDWSRYCIDLMTRTMTRMMLSLIHI